MRLIILNILDQISNIKWNIKFYFKLITDKTFKECLSFNKRFKNLHKGERCFIVGNGPSLKKLDLTKITNEITFTVNNIMHDKKIYETINPNYHVLTDPLYFRLNQTITEDNATIELLKSIKYKNIRPICISTYEGRNAIKSYGLDKSLDFVYLFQHQYFTNTSPKIIELNKNIPSTQNVVQTAILSAIYMGFKEIYLIGCDMTSLFSTFESNADGEKCIKNDNHVYKYTENEKKLMLKDAIHNDNEYMLYDYAKTFTIFKQIRKYALKSNIKIINATIGGGLDVFERVKYDMLFSK